MRVTHSGSQFKTEITNSMDQSPFWEAKRYSASQKTSHVLWNPKVYYRFHKHKLPISVLSQINPVHAPMLRFHFNIIFSSTYVFHMVFFPQVFPPKMLYAPLLFPIQATCHGRLILLDLITRIIFGKEYKSERSHPLYAVFSHYCITSFLPGPNIFLSTLF